MVLYCCEIAGKDIKYVLNWNGIMKLVSYLEGLWIIFSFSYPRRAAQSEPISMAVFQSTLSGSSCLEIIFDALS